MSNVYAGSKGGAGTARRLHMLERGLYERAIFVPPGYTSLLYAHSYEDNSCPYNTALFKVIIIIIIIQQPEQQERNCPCQKDVKLADSVPKSNLVSAV